MATKMQAEQVRIGAQALPGSLVVPPHALGMVVFAHGNGGLSQSTRDLFGANILERLRLATLLLDLLTETEAKDTVQQCNVELLGQRLEQVLDWLESRRDLADFGVGLFGASAGAAAALWAAAMNPSRVGAVVSRGGRPELAARYLRLVQAPTLLIVGGADAQAGQLNRQALGLLHCNKRLEVVPGATLLFNEPVATETVAHLAGNWFVNHLPRKHSTV